MYYGNLIYNIKMKYNLEQLPAEILAKIPNKKEAFNSNDEHQQRRKSEVFFKIFQKQKSLVKPLSLNFLQN